MVVELVRAPLLTKYGEWTQVLYSEGPRECFALLLGDPSGRSDVLCRVHSSCMSAHVFMGVECDCREEFEIAMQRIAAAGMGVILWLDHEGKGNGNYAALASVALKRQGLSQSAAYEALGFPVDARSFRAAAEMLRALQVRSVELLTNNPTKIRQLVEEGVPVSASQRIAVEARNEHRTKLLKDKADVEGHLLS